MSSRTPSVEPPPPPRTHRSRRHGARNRAYSLPRGDKSPRRRSEVRLLLCIFHTTSHNWSTEPLRFDPHRINDRELWTDIRDIFRQDLQKPWKRLLGLKKVKSIVPIAMTPNGVPVRIDPKDYPDSKQFLHAYHHPERVRPDHHWVDWFVAFDEGDQRTNGLEFVEGIWAEKLVIIAILATVAIIVVSIVWCVLGGSLQTVFTVMSFVLGLVTAEIALAALYYQLTLPG